MRGHGHPQGNQEDHPFSGNQCTSSNEQDRSNHDPDDDDPSLRVAHGRSDDRRFGGEDGRRRGNEHRGHREPRDDDDYDHLSADGPTYLRQLQAREESRRFSGTPARGRALRDYDGPGGHDRHDQGRRDDAAAHRRRDGSFRRRRRPLAWRRV